VLQELPEALAQAQWEAEKGRPCLVNVAIGASTGALVLPTARVPFVP